jgi:hypothetical protein
VLGDNAAVKDICAFERAEHPPDRRGPEKAGPTMNNALNAVARLANL